MEIAEVYCQICATLFSTQFEIQEGGGVVCSDECWEKYQQKRGAAKCAKTRRLNIAELDPCPSLDPFIHELKSIPDLLICRYFIPPETEWVFRGPPGGWPEGHGLDFPRATLRAKDDSDNIRRAYGLANVVQLLRELHLPYASTRAFAATKAMKRPSLAELKK